MEHPIIDIDDIPLSGWGIVAVLLMMAACLLALVSYSPVTGYTLLILPIAVQEMVLAVWLLVKGFNPPTFQPGSGRKAQPPPAGAPQPWNSVATPMSPALPATTP